MVHKITVTILLVIFLSFGVHGQNFSKEYWKQLADNSKVIIVGNVEEVHQVGRPEKFKLTPDNPNPSQTDLYVGRVFRVKVTETLKGKIKTEKVGEDKFANIFLYWIGGIPSIGDPKLFKGKEYVLFLEPNTDKELEGKGMIAFSPSSRIITKPFDYKSSYVIVHGFRGTVGIGTDKNKRIKEIKKSF